MHDLSNDLIGLALFVVAVLGAMVQSIFSKPPKPGRRAPRPPIPVEDGAAEPAPGRNNASGRSRLRLTIVGALALFACPTAGGSGDAEAGGVREDGGGGIRIVIDSVATTAAVPDQAVIQVVAAAAAGESYLAAHHLAQMAQTFLARGGYPPVTGRRIDLEMVLRARQQPVGVDGQGAPVLSRWVQLAVVQPRSQAELWSGTAMSVGSCTLGEVGEVLVDELIGRIGTAGIAETWASVPVAHGRRGGCRD